MVYDRFRKILFVLQYLKQLKFLKIFVWFNIEENSSYKFIMYVMKKFLNIFYLFLQYIFMIVSFIFVEN